MKDDEVNQGYNLKLKASVTYEELAWCDSRAGIIFPSHLYTKL
jgi:hypothetical protein